MLYRSERGNSVLYVRNYRLTYLYKNQDKIIFSLKRLLLTRERERERERERGFNYTAYHEIYGDPSLRL